MDINNISVHSADIKQYQTHMVQATQEKQSNVQTESEQTVATGSKDRDGLVQAIEKANHIKAGQTECQFSIHKGTNQIMIKIIDQTTKEVIKEIPSEKILDMVAKMCDLAGVFVDEKR